MTLMLARMLSALVLFVVVVALAVTGAPRLGGAMTPDAAPPQDHAAMGHPAHGAATQQDGGHKAMGAACCDLACHAAAQIVSDIAFPDLPRPSFRPERDQAATTLLGESLFRPPRQIA